MEKILKWFLIYYVIGFAIVIAIHVLYPIALCPLRVVCKPIPLLIYHNIVLETTDF